MIIKDFVDEGVGNTSYLVASQETCRAAVIDPERDVDRHLPTAERLAFCLAFALDTHLHADFISGAREFSAQAGQQIGASAEAQHGFGHLPLRDGATLGSVT